MGSHWYAARVVGKKGDSYLVNYDYEKTSEPFAVPANDVRRATSPAALSAAARTLRGSNLPWLNDEQRATMAAEAAARAAGPIEGDGDRAQLSDVSNEKASSLLSQRAVKERAAMKRAEKAAKVAGKMPASAGATKTIVKRKSAKARA